MVKVTKGKVRITGIKPKRRKKSNIEIFNEKIKNLRQMPKGKLKGNARDIFV